MIQFKWKIIYILKNVKLIKYNKYIIRFDNVLIWINIFFKEKNDVVIVYIKIIKIS